MSLPPWHEFERFVSDMLSVAGFEVATDIRFQGRQTDIWCSARGGILPARILVECKSTKGKNALPVSAVTEFCNRVHLARLSGAADFGWLITNHAIPANAASVIREAHLEGACSVLTSDSLLAKLIDLPAYVGRVVRSFKASPTGYVDPAVHVQTGIDGRYPTNSTFMPFFRRWIADGGRPLLLLLGDFGQGKTTCCEQVVRELHSLSPDLSARFPIYIRLRDVANQGYSLPEMLRVCLQERYGLDYRSFDLIDTLAARGLLLFVFDGLDEITYSLRWSEIFEGFKQIVRLMHRKGKIIVTSRPGAFPDAFNALERLVQLAPTLPNAGYPRSSYVIAYLQYFDTAQVTQAIQNFGVTDPNGVRLLMAEVHDLTDLSCRPITLSMILQTLDKLRSHAIHGHADLYATYTDQWLARDEWRSTVAALSVEKGQDLKRDFLQKLAWEMFDKRLPNVETTFLDELVRRYASDTKLVQELTQAFSHEIAVCSFLDARRDGTFAFAHKSFLEFFLAKYLAARDNATLLNLLSVHVFEPEVCSFLAQLADFPRLLRSQGLHQVLTDRPTLALNLVQISSSCESPLIQEARLPKGARLRIQSRRPVVLQLTDSDIESLDIASEAGTEIRLKDSRLTQVTCRSATTCALSVESSSLAKLEMGGAGESVLTLRDSTVEVGRIAAPKRLDLATYGRWLLKDVVIESRDVRITSDNAVVAPSAVSDFLRAAGVHLWSEELTKRSQKSEKQTEKRRRDQPRIRDTE